MWDYRQSGPIIPSALKAGFILGAAFAAAFGASAPAAGVGFDAGGVLDALLPESDMADLLSFKAIGAPGRCESL